MTRDNELCGLYVLGVPVPALAERFGKTEWAIREMARQRRLNFWSLKRVRRIRLSRIRANIEAMPNRRFWDE